MTLTACTDGLGMTFNPSKCYIMHIARSQRMEKHYQMCGTILGTIHQAKYLGVTISDDLQWHPKLEYCASVWDPHQQQDIDALERINRRAARVTYNKLWRERDVSVSALLADLKWEPLSECRRQQRLSLMSRITQELVAVPPTCLGKPARTTRGHSFKYRTIGAMCEPARNSFYPRTIIDWKARRALSPDVVASPSLDSFKHRLAMP